MKTNHLKSPLNVNISTLLLLLTLLFVQACGTDDPEAENEVELINEVHMKFTPVGGGAEIEWVYSVEEGAEAPTITVSPLAANTTYDVLLEFYGEHHHHDDEEHSDDEHADDDHSDDHDHDHDGEMENITEEIRQEGAEHQVFFEVSGANLTFTYEDADENGRPIGLINTLQTGSAVANAQLRVVLRHDLNKAAEGVASGNLANAGGATDVDVTFPFSVQ